MDARPLSNTWDNGRTSELATELRDVLSVTLRGHFDDNYHIGNLVVEPSDFCVVPEHVHN